MSTYATISDVRDRGVTVEQADDDAVTLALERATVAIDAFCRRDFHASEKTYHLDGSGRRSLFLDDRPVVSILELSIDDVAVPATDIVLYPEAGYIRLDGLAVTWPRLPGGVFSEGAQNVMVRGVFGYDPVPPEVVEATILLALYFLGRAEAAGLGTGSVGTEQAIGIKRVKVDDLSVDFEYPRDAGVVGRRTTGLGEADRLLDRFRMDLEATAV